MKGWTESAIKNLNLKTESTKFDKSIASKKAKNKQTRNNPDQLRKVDCRTEIIGKEINYYYD